MVTGSCWRRGRVLCCCFVSSTRPERCSKKRWACFRILNQSSSTRHIHLLTTKEHHAGRSTLLSTTTLSGSPTSSSSDICFVLRSLSAPSRVQYLQSSSLHYCQTSYRSFFFYSFISKCCLFHNASYLPYFCAYSAPFPPDIGVAAHRWCSPCFGGSETDSSVSP